MPTLLLVDYENVPKVDLSVLDEGYRAVIFVGKNQQPPRASKRTEIAHRFVRVERHEALLNRVRYFTQSIE